MPFTIGVFTLVVVAAIALFLAFRPLFPRSEPSTGSAAGDASPFDRRLERLAETPIAPEDGFEPWEREAPMVQGPPRLGQPFRPRPETLIIEGRPLPFPDLLVEPTGASDESVFIGRSLGRPLHAVRVAPGVYLDLVAVGRWLPWVTLPQDGALLTVGQPDVGVPLANWWIDGTLPEPPAGPDYRTRTYLLGAHSLSVQAWLPGLAWVDGVPGGSATVSFAGQEATIATSKRAGRALGPPSPAWRWHRAELLELAAVGHRLAAEDVDLIPMLDGAFADRTRPVPHDDQDALAAAAVLNWAGSVYRRHGFPGRALALFDAGLRCCRDTHDDNRADLHYNRGLARLHREFGGRPPVWSDTVDVAAVDQGLQDLTVAATLSSRDRDPWVWIATIETLRGGHGIAADAWLQAATRTSDLEAREALLRRADTSSSLVVSGRRASDPA